MQVKFIETVVTAAFMQEYTLLIPQPLVDGMVQKTTKKHYLKGRITVDEINMLIRFVSEIAQSIKPINEPLPAVTRDPKDDYLLAYAVVGEADYLVTGDNDLLILKKVEGMKIITPRDFAEVISKPELR